tara:strand:+ start:7870 stop:8358 length:489 start_codon:yes stop_codon:yes gene_type:complete
MIKGKLKNKSNLKDMIVYIDMDGVLADFDSKAALTPKHIKQKYGDNLHRVPGFYRDLKPLPGAVNAFNTLCELYTVYIASTPSWNNPSSWIDKRLWVQEHLGPNAFKKLILTNNKGLLKGDILIDDNVWNGVEDFEGQHIHFGTDTNFMNWEQTLKHLTENV